MAKLRRRTNYTDYAATRGISLVYAANFCRRLVAIVSAAERRLLANVRKHFLHFSVSGMFENFDELYAGVNG